ncbi:DEKNAAC103266 [Brettanomyces naardenensis]|uniref:DEKNAAC103266 n=1 Tax=Brettanomyces naardenensis TaxID=13370 RepID=A0A448YMX9_BRENA|nr:DEKNAAC103266 [Brettanomyces naardenensis]
MSKFNSGRNSGRNNLASKYLEAIGSPEILSTAPLQPSLKSNRGTFSSLKHSPSDEHMSLSSKENAEPKAPGKKHSGRESPVKQLIMQKERDTIDNHATDFVPAPDHVASPVKFAGFQKSAIQVSKRKTSNPSRSQIRKMSEISRALSASPSLKNLNKLKLIENKLTTRRVSGGKKRSVSGLQYKLKLNDENSREAVGGSAEPINASSGYPKLDFICRLLEVKQWIDCVLEEQLDIDESNISEFQDYFRNGVLLAEIIKKLDPTAIRSIYYGQYGTTNKFKNKKGLYFKFTENIVQFINYLNTVHMPDMFIFETRDLFELKNFPKVIFCLQALSYICAMRGTAPAIHRVSMDKIIVSPEEIKKVEAQIRGVKLPNFENIYDGVRVNVGSDIRPVALIPQEDVIPEKRDNSQTPSVASPPKVSVSEMIGPVDTTLSDVPEVPGTPTELDVPDSYSPPPEASPTTPENIPDDDYLLPLHDPVVKQEETTQARTLFRDFNPTMDIDMEALEKKYNAMIQHDNGLSLMADYGFDVDIKQDDTPVKIDGSFPVENLLELQSIARGALVRYSLFVNKFMFKVFTPEIVTFQSIVRGAIIRRKLSAARKQLTANSRSLSVLQEVLRKRKRDDWYTKVKQQLALYEGEIICLQNLIRGGWIRDGIYRRRKLILRQANAVVAVQSYIRGVHTRQLISKHGAKGIKRYKTIIRPANSDNRKRRPVSEHGHKVSEYHKWTDLRIHENEELLNEFSAIARGSLARKGIRNTRKHLRRRAGEVRTLQSVFRGVLTRFYIEVHIERLKIQSPEIAQLQSHIRGALLRYRIQQRAAWFHRSENVAKIIKIQNFFRASIAAHDYKSLINEKSPPLQAVKNYIDLLSGSDVGVEDEMSIEKYKRQIATETQRIEKWEQDLKQLGVKIQLLKRNRISLEEVVRFKDDNLNLSDYSHNLSDLMSKSLYANPDKMVDKSSKNLLDLYGKIFYLLQTKSDYFAELLNSVDCHALKNNLRSGSIEDWILKVFNYSIVSPETFTGQSREEFLLMKLILSSCYKFFKEMKTKKEFQSFLKARQSLQYEDVKHWEILLLAYINLPQQRFLAKNLLSGLILRVTSDSDAWYESDPARICKKLLEKDEENGKITLKALDMEDPIDDPDTRDQFVKNLSALREASYDIMKMIGELVDRVPCYLRCVCREIYLQLKDQFPGESEKYYLSTVGSVFFKCYVLPLFTKPENYSINIARVSDELETVEVVISNLEQVAKVLNQLVSMRPFPSSEVYLQPLNPFIEEFTEGVRAIVKELIDVQPIDECYQMSSVYDDVASHDKPVLKILSEDVPDLLDYLRVNIVFVAPERNDYLRYLLLGANELSANHHKLDTEKGFLNLVLQPTTGDTNSKDLEAKTLIMEAKRYIIYILQVQDGEDLLDLMLSEITPRDELKFKDIIKEEKRKIREVSGLDSVFEKQALDDIYNSTYPQVKKHAIELVLELENKGIVTRSDCYQSLLDEIARDIKTKKIQKEDRDRRLKVVVDTLTKLTQKERTCSKLYSEYIKDIDKAMLKLQNQSAGKKKSLFSRLFSKQYYYQLELKRKKGYIPTFGSFKYDGKYLKERNIIRSINSTSSSSSSGVKPGRINFMFSCEKQGEFIVDVSNNALDISGFETLTLDDLLNYQYENKKQFNLFGGGVTFNTDQLVAFIFHKFYQVKK